MIQDLDKYCFYNQYDKKTFPQSTDYVLVFKDKEVLVKQAEDGALQLPKAYAFNQDSLIYLFKIDNTAFFLSPDCNTQVESFAFKSVQIFRNDNPRHLCFAIACAYHLYTWYQRTKFCGACSHKLELSATQRAMVCKHCGQIYFPTIAPAVIVAITDGDKVVVTRYKDRPYRGIALIAGFCEFGESVEQTAAREAMEEVGLKIKDLKYFGSQPWGTDSNLLIGFMAKVDGSTTIIRDEGELSEAMWIERDKIEKIDSDISLTKTMINYFKEHGNNL